MKSSTLYRRFENKDVKEVTDDWLEQLLRNVEYQKMERLCHGSKVKRTNWPKKLEQVQKEEQVLDGSQLQALDQQALHLQYQYSIKPRSLS